MSGGLLVELGSHLFDAAAMFVAATPNRDQQRPIRSASPLRQASCCRDAEGDIDDHVYCVFEYAMAGYVDRGAAEGPQEDRPCSST